MLSELRSAMISLPSGLRRTKDCSAFRGTMQQGFSVSQVDKPRILHVVWILHNNDFARSRFLTHHRFAYFWIFDTLTIFAFFPESEILIILHIFWACTLSSHPSLSFWCLKLLHSFIHFAIGHLSPVSSHMFLQFRSHFCRFSGIYTTGTSNGYFKSVHLSISSTHVKFYPRVTE